MTFAYVSPAYTSRQDARLHAKSPGCAGVCGLATDVEQRQVDVLLDREFRRTPTLTAAPPPPPPANLPADAVRTPRQQRRDKEVRVGTRMHTRESRNGKGVRRCVRQTRRNH